jgi:hypothetical protein
MPDFSMTGVLNPGQVSQPPSEDQNMGAAATGMASYLKETKDRADAAQKAEQSFEMTSDHKAGTTTMTLPTEAAQMYMQSFQEMQHIRENYGKMSQQNQQQMEGMRQHPWQNALAQIAASVGASSKDPLVRGLGDAAQRLNPTMGELQQKQMGIMKGEEGALQGQMGLMDRMNQHQNAATYRDQVLQQKTDSAAAKTQHDEDVLSQKKDAEAARESDKQAQEKTNLNNKWLGITSHGAFSEKAYAAEYKAAFPKASDTEIQAQAEGLKIMAAQVKSEKTAEAQQKRQDKIEAADQSYRNKVEFTRTAAKEKGAAQGLKGAQLKQYEDTETAADLVTQMEKSLDDHPDLFGLNPVAMVKRAGARFEDQDVQETVSRFAHAPALMVKLLGEGARGYAPQQRKWVESKVPKMSDSEEMIKGKFEFLHGFLDANRRGQAAGYLVNKALAENQMTPEQAKNVLLQQAQTGGGPAAQVAPLAKAGAPAKKEGGKSGTTPSGTKYQILD